MSYIAVQLQVCLVGNKKVCKHAVYMHTLLLTELLWSCTSLLSNTISVVPLTNHFSLQLVFNLLSKFSFQTHGWY